MAKIITLPIPYTTVFVKSETALGFPVTAWFPRSRLSRGRAKLELRDPVSTAAATISAAIGFQFANCESDNVVDVTATLLHGFISTAGVSYPPAMVDFAAVNADKYLCRVVIYAKLGTSETDLTFARVGGVVELEECV